MQKTIRNEVRLELLLKIHGMTQGNINKFNEAYRVDFYGLTGGDFAAMLSYIITNPIDFSKVLN